MCINIAAVKTDTILEKGAYRDLFREGAYRVAVVKDESCFERTDC